MFLLSVWVSLFSIVAWSNRLARVDEGGYLFNSTKALIQYYTWFINNNEPIIIFTIACMVQISSFGFHWLCFLRHWFAFPWRLGKLSPSHWSFHHSSSSRQTFRRFAKNDKQNTSSTRINFKTASRFIYDRWSSLVQSSVSYQFTIHTSSGCT